MHSILDILLTATHILIILINLFFWIFPKTRKLHLVVFGITCISWLGLGYFYGWGYCFLTDWHYQVLNELGYKDLPLSFITFLLQRLSIPADDKWVIQITEWVFIAIFLLTFYVNIKDFLDKKKASVDKT